MRAVFRTTNVATAGTEQQVTTSPLRVRAITFKARSTNAGVIFLAETSAVSSAAGFALLPSEALSLDFGDGSVGENDFWVDADASNCRVDTTAVIDP